MTVMNAVGIIVIGAVLVGFLFLLFRQDERRRARRRPRPHEGSDRSWYWGGQGRPGG